MKNTFGTNLSLTIFGESHGEAIGCVIDGLTPGVDVDEELIAFQMEKRKGINAISTKRREKDQVKILSGVFEGKTTGTPICLLIENGDTKSNHYELTKNLARPGHADYTAECKYHGFQDYRGGGHFSGRITAPVVAAGAVAISALSKKGIKIGTHISSCGGIEDRAFENLESDIDLLFSKEMPVLCEKAEKAIVEKIGNTAREGDSIGGILSSAVIGLPAGLGEPFFDSVESLLSHALFSVPAVKGIEFGDGFGFASLKGSEANDEFEMQDGNIKTKTNHNGGINGGITNGMPLLFKVCVKPTPSIYKAQNTVDFKNKENALLNIKGRHDPAIIHRARVVVDSLTALVLCDLLIGRYGTDYFGE